MKRILLIHRRLSSLIGFALLLALCTPALMKRAFLQSPSTNSFAPLVGALGSQAFLPGAGFENPKCAKLRDDIKSTEGEISGLQEDLKNASPGQKPAIVKQINAARKKLQNLRAKAKALGCKL